jgi:UDPglucose 6-dehydrogenase
MDAAGVNPVRSVAIVGGGVVGRATGKVLIERGIAVTFVDSSDGRIDELRGDGLSAISPEELEKQSPDAYLISVPTPTRNGTIDLGAVRSASDSVGRSLAHREDWSLVVVRSTVPPGTTDQVVTPAVEESAGRRRGTDFGVSMNPEFLRARFAEEDFAAPRVIVIGSDSDRTESAMRSMYASWPDVKTVVMTNAEAEATKYTANLFNASKISLFNELHATFARLGVDSTVPFATAAEGAEGLWNPWYGTRGGEPYGGVCLPKDAAGFAAFVHARDIDTPLLDAVIATNVALGGADFEGERS